MKKYYRNKKQTLVIELKLRKKEHNQEVFTASGCFYDSLTDLTDSNLIMAGQCLDCIPEFVKTIEDKKIKKELSLIHKLWTKYHLNDMRADCKHAHNEKVASKNLIIYKYSFKGSYRELENKYKLINQNKYLKNNIKIPNYIKNIVTKYKWGFETTLKPSQLPKYLIKFYKIKETETKIAGCVTYSELCPNGILCKPCPECGYEYGTRWNYRPIPTKDKNIIKNLIGVTKQ